MLHYELKSTVLGRFPAIAKEVERAERGGVELWFCAGLDVELGGAEVSVVVDGGQPRCLGKRGRGEVLSLVRELAGRGHRVSVAQEACGFGPYLHRGLCNAGAASYVLAPENLGGRRKTDKVDARKLVQLVHDHVAHGNRESFRVVRDIGEAARQRRALSRQREQLQKLRNQLAGNGRGLMHDFGFYEVPERWWGARKWPKLLAELEAHEGGWLAGMVAPLQASIAGLHARVREAEKGLAEGRGAEVRELPKGLGETTADILDSEVGDWGRFNNRGQAGSFTGLCSGERSSGGTRRQGNIDRQGNRRVRKQLVEAVWRLKLWNPGWRGFAKFPHVFERGARVGPAAKKKAVVACARLLMVDLWRLRTGQTTLGNLGLVPA